jgi:hypothetical protein
LRHPSYLISIGSKDSPHNISHEQVNNPSKIVPIIHRHAQNAVMDSKIEIKNDHPDATNGSGERKGSGSIPDFSALSLDSDLSSVSLHSDFSSISINSNKDWQKIDKDDQTEISLPKTKRASRLKMLLKKLYKRRKKKKAETTRS